MGNSNNSLNITDTTGFRKFFVYFSLENLRKIITLDNIFENI